MDNTITVYAQINEDKNIIAVNSSVFLPDTVDWVQIDEGEGDKYAHAQNNYFDKPLVDENGCANYKLVDGRPIERTEEEKVADTDYVEQIRAAKLSEISDACEQTIYSGVDVEDSKGIEHFSLTMADQTNLTALVEAVAQGGISVPYHADEQLCRQFTADEIKAVYAAAKAYITKNVTLCNHLNVWIRRCTTAQEINAITYTTNLPDDLQANFNSVLGITA